MSNNTSKKQTRIAFLKKYMSNILGLVLSLLIACFIWGYVMNIESPESEQTFSAVHVEVNGINKINSESALSVISESEKINVSFTLQGKKSVLSEISSESIKAYVDVSSITKPGIYDLDIGYMPISDATVINISPSKIKLSVDATGTISVPVSVKFDDCHVPGGYSTGDCMLSVSTIEVSGAMADLEKIGEAVITLNTGTLTSSITAMNEVPVICDLSGNPFESDYISYTKTYVDVFVPVYFTKDIYLKTDSVYGIFNDKNTNITVSPERVSVTGDASVVSSMPDYYSIGTINEKDGIGEYIFDIDFSSISDDITIVSGEKNATVRIEHLGTVESGITFAKEYFKINNPGGSEFEFQPGYTGEYIKCRIDSGLVGSLSDYSNVEATLDLSLIGNVTGAVEAPLRISFVNLLNGKAYEIGEYYVKVTVGSLEMHG